MIQGEDDLLQRVRTPIPSQVYSRGNRPNLRKECNFHYLLRVSRDSYGLPALSRVCSFVTVIPGPGKVPLRHIESDAAKKRRGGKTVLVVEDDPAIRKKVHSAFLSNGFAVCGEADNGREGIELAKEIKPDLIVLDLSMPVMNGLEAAPQLKVLFPRTPIILFTLHASKLLQQQAAHIGVDLVVSKFEGLSMLVSKAHTLMGD